MEDEHNELKEIMSQMNLDFINPFANFSCEECSLPLKDYGSNLIFEGKNDVFSEKLLCGKCAADFFGEDVFNSENIETEYKNAIDIETYKKGSQAKIRGMQTTVKEVLKSFASGMTEKDVIKKFPNLTHKHILDCYAFAAEHL